MTEETANNEQVFAKTTEAGLEEVKELVSEWGRIRLSDLKVGKHLILKVLEPIYHKDSVDEKGEVTVRHFVKCEYKHVKLEGRPQFEVQVGPSCAARLQDKWPDQSYVGLYAYFTRTSYQGTYPQHINPIKDYVDVDKEEMFKLKAGDTGVTVPDKPAVGNADLSSITPDKAPTVPFLLNSLEQGKINDIKEAIVKQGKRELASLSVEEWLKVLSKNGFTEIRAGELAKHCGEWI